MYKVINGKRYNTETAELMGEDSYGGRTDFSHWSEELYRKKTGEFFLYGEGGPLSRYSESTGQNEMSGGERIMPLSYHEAQDWAERHLDGDDYDKIFGAPDESDERRTIALSLSAVAAETLKRLASEQGRPMSQIVEDMILGRKEQV